MPADQNSVEPLSNDLKLSMTMQEIKDKFGPPTDTQWDPRAFGYKDFSVRCGGSRDAIWHVDLKGSVKLSSGIAVGSARADVQRVFGTERNAVQGQYVLSFDYDPAGHVTGIAIEPANGEFTPLDAPPAPGIPTLPSVVGDWYGIGSKIEMNPDGTYKYGLLSTGKWRVVQDAVVFDGPLAAWGKGRGKDGHLEFTFTDDQGSHTYSFRKQ